MKTKSSEFKPIASRLARRTAPGHFEPRPQHAMPEAFDAIFANLALKQEGVERANQSPWNVAQVRETATEMERQRERLAKLLRDIDLSA